MKTQPIQYWGPRSVSYWLTALAAVGIIFLGLRFIVAPAAGAEGFGIPLAPTREAMAYGWIKGIRDLFSGVVVLLFLIPRKLQATTFAFGAAIIIPLSDCLTILAVNGTQDVTHWLIHGGTAGYMMITTFFLVRAEPKK
ncbi:hypothetical protein GCM10028803_04470 [Larkinella knui]|uniref:DUF4267 domain-containing protein n=1 Tax=Larkinella knui TaxID=2025310 RepID=A0A3P1CLT7_9BACT|nr:DUF4267 domain-containing protein [Larkinella knui]RRB13874.1 DUF4267 domain-containing protein [Larkinella knui]